METKRRKFLLTLLSILPLTTFANIRAKLFMKKNPLSRLLEFPLMHAIFGRRSRRFGRGMEIPSGPLAYKSKLDPLPLSEFEQSILIAAGTGVTGWNFGVPFGPDRPKEHASYTLRFTGRTTPSAGGFGTPAMLFTNDTGTFITNTRNVIPTTINEAGEDFSDVERIIAICKENTTKLSDTRLDLPAEPPHMLEPNLWMANAPGSTLFMPIADASEQMLSFMALTMSNGNVIMDDEAKKPAGNLRRFISSGLLNDNKRVPLSVLHQMVYESNCTEVAFAAHNMVLTLQALGLGGLYFSGLNRWSILGAFADKGIKGMGFRFVNNENWTLPNPVGLDGIYEALCPPYYPNMRAAVEAFVERKFGPKGAYNKDSPGPWKESKVIKGGVTPYSEEFVDCLTEVAQYIYDKHGKFPGTFSTIVLPGYVQAVHLDNDFYDKFYKPGAYLKTHTDHMNNLHSD
jgi:hypothetical protein